MNNDQAKADLQARKKKRAEGENNPVNKMSNLEMRLFELERRKHHWLMEWTREMTEMNEELYDMQVSLNSSIIRTESRKSRDRAKRSNQKHSSQDREMSKEELEKLPVRMRPKPKYSRLLTKQEKSFLNERSYTTLIQELKEQSHGTVPKLKDPVPSRPPTKLSVHKFHLPPVASDRVKEFKVLLAKNPFDPNRERKAVLTKVKSEAELNFQIFRAAKDARGVRMAASADTEFSLPKLPSVTFKIQDEPREKDQLQEKSERASGKDHTITSSDGDYRLPGLPAITLTPTITQDQQPPARPADRNIPEPQKLHPPKIYSQPSALSLYEKLPKNENVGDDEQRRAQPVKQPAEQPKRKVVEAQPVKQPAEQPKRKVVEAFRTNKAPSVSKALKQKPVERPSSGSSSASSYSPPELERNHVPTEAPQMPMKNLPSLDDSVFRQQLIEQLEKQRHERIVEENAKMGLSRDAVKSSGVLKVRMPEVLRQEQLNKQQNRAVFHVQEKIKQRMLERQQTNLTSGISQSMPALDTIGKVAQKSWRYISVDA